MFALFFKNCFETGDEEVPLGIAVGGGPEEAPAGAHARAAG